MAKSMATESLVIARKGYMEDGWWISWPVWGEDENCVASRPFMALYRDGSIIYEDGTQRDGPAFKVAMSKKKKIEALREMLDLLQEAAEDPVDGKEFLEEIVAVEARLAELV